MTLASITDLAGRIDGAVEGAGGRLFFDRAPGFDARALYGAPYADAEGLARVWGPPLKRLRRLGDETGAVVVLLIAPDAHGVHADDLPPDRAYARPSIADAVAALAAEHGVAVLHPRDRLRDAAGPLEVFRRTDSHWSAYGAWTAYRELMAALSPCGPAVLEPDAFDYGWRTESGDLGALFDPPRKGPVATPRLHAPRAKVVADARNGGRHALRVTETEEPTLPSAVMFRDSYAGELAPFLAEGFRRLVMVGADNLFFEDIVREERPQAIIVERGERTLPFGLVDPPPLEGWRDHWPEADPAMLGEVAADAGPLLRAGVAHLRGGEDALARDLFAHACVLRPWSGEAYEHLGYAALRLRDLDLARYALDRATQVSPHRAGGWLWLGEAVAARGDGVAALAALARGLEACPGDPALRAAQERLSA